VTRGVIPLYLGEIDKFVQKEMELGRQVNLGYIVLFLAFWNITYN